MTVKQNKVETPAKWYEKVVTFLFFWAAWLVLATASVVGFIRVLDGVDPVIKVPIAVIATALLVKEVMFKDE